MFALINDIFNPANAAQLLSEISGTGVEAPREVIDIEAEIIEEQP